jgi:hypothetical protein
MVDVTTKSKVLPTLFTRASDISQNFNVVQADQTSKERKYSFDPSHSKEEKTPTASIDLLLSMSHE